MITNELAARRQRLERLLEQGIDPYPSVNRRTHSIKDVLEKYTSLQNSGEHIVISGRLMARRKHGGSTFLIMRDDAHNLQVYCKKDVLGQDGYKFLTVLDLGDFIEIDGTLFITHK